MTLPEPRPPLSTRTKVRLYIERNAYYIGYGLIVLAGILCILLAGLPLIGAALVILGAGLGFFHYLERG
jgi:hypothetical protein